MSALPPNPSTPATPAPRVLQLSTPAPNPTPVELEAYKALASLFNSEETSFWTRNNILVAVHGVLLAATAGIVSNAEKTLASGAPQFAATLLFLALAILSAAGLGMAIAWLFMVARSEKIADVILSQLKKIESEFAARSGVNLSQPFHVFINFGNELVSLKSDRLGWQERLTNVRLSNIWRRVGFWLASLWALLLFSFIFVIATGRATPLPARQEVAPSTIDAKVVADALTQAASAAVAAADAAKASSQFAQAAAMSAEASASAAKRGARLRTSTPQCLATGQPSGHSACNCCQATPAATR